MKMVSLYNSSEEFYRKCLKAIVGDVSHQTMIDLCAGRATHTQSLGFSKHTLIDIHDWPERAGNPDFIVADVLGDHSSLNAHYDVAMCCDAIEHFSYSDGLLVIEKMEQIANVQVIFTPTGFYGMSPDNGGPDTHKSGWVTEDFKTWACLECPAFHPSLHIGAFFVWKCKTEVETLASFKRAQIELRKENLVK